MKQVNELIKLHLSLLKPEQTENGTLLKLCRENVTVLMLNSAIDERYMVFTYNE